MKLEHLTSEELIALYRSTNDEDVKEYFFKRNIKIVPYVANKLCKWHSHRCELESEGYVGMVKAFNTFDISKGHKFSTYATWCIRNEILMLMRKYKSRARFSFISLALKKNSIGREEITYEDTLTSDNPSSDTYAIVRNKINEFYINADEREKKIYYLMMNKDLTQEEIAAEIGISRPSITRIQKKIKQQFMIND